MPGKWNYTFDADDLVKRYVAGESSVSLQKRFRTDRTTILEILGEYGVKPRGRVEALLLAILKRIDGDDLAARYVAGESIHVLSKSFGVDRYVVRRVLREHGVELRDRAAAVRLSHAAIFDEEAMVKRYVAGESVNVLGTVFGVSRQVIVRVLGEHEVAVRGIKDANGLREDLITPGQRLSRTTKHAVIWEGRTYQRMVVTNPGWLRKKAVTLERTKAQQRPEEKVILALLAVGWVSGEQIAVDRYNIDFTHGNVAVEVHSDGLHPFRTERTVCRAIDLAERGWHVIFFWPNSGQRRIGSAGIAELVARAERLNGDPSARRQYAVIRGGGEVVASGSFDTEQRTLVPAPVDAEELPDRADSRIAS